MMILALDDGIALMSCGADGTVGRKFVKMTRYRREVVYRQIFDGIWLGRRWVACLIFNFLILRSDLDSINLIK